MNLDELRDDLIIKQKKGLPFILASVLIWLLITVVVFLDLPQNRENFLVFCCSCPLMPLAMLFGKLLKVDIFDKSNPLGNLGLLFTLNQFLYILIVMWAFYGAPEKMVMIYAMVFGGHLLPYSWLYKSISYRVVSIIIPILSLIVGIYFSGLEVAIMLVGIEVVFVILLFQEMKRFV